MAAMSRIPSWIALQFLVRVIVFGCLFANNTKDLVVDAAVSPVGAEDAQFWDSYLRSNTWSVPPNPNDLGNTNANANAKPPQCASPFGFDERDRLIECHGDGASAIVLVTFDAAASFATSVKEAVVNFVGDPMWNPASVMEFTVQQTSSSSPSPSSSTSQCALQPELCDLLQCTGTTYGTLGGLVGTSLSQAVLPADALFSMCRDCSESFLGTDFRGIQGGSGSGAGFQLYCSDISSSKNRTELFNMGGGGGGGTTTMGVVQSGGGAGMQVLIDNDSDSHQSDPFNTCLGGGCGWNSEGSLNGTLTSDVGCNPDQFAMGITALRDAVQACHQDPATTISVAAGGGSGGGISDATDELLFFQYGIGFGYTLGPSGDGDAGGRADLPCALAFANDVCSRSGYLEDDAAAWELCLCPLQKIYSPTPFNCTYPGAPPVEGDPITEELLATNCAGWCPSPPFQTPDGQACDFLPEACAGCSTTR